MVSERLVSEWDVKLCTRDGLIGSFLGGSCHGSWVAYSAGLTSDLRPSGHWVESRSGRGCVTTRGKLFTLLCSCDHAV